ncbi:VOC family protein [Jannaschia donghaensis]|uniref:Putative enzyme related to lactoylglutathione lyase n=1 Tax=Jannaschia donghaensis TaxID=420998 RepID=A0A0M6YDC4_9RHOB|nr:VOC family protein [Jannaschia donghaensis]CTQ48338.1 putative enzyme related to lactoylglutathione lyase [Jannaschia donghaensis]
MTVGQTLALVTIVVEDYDPAIAFFTRTLGFDLVEDTYQPEQDKRWVVVRPSGGGAGLLLARATTPDQTATTGAQTGGRVAFFLRTDDIARDHAIYLARGVVFVRPPATMPYGTVAVFRDICGNLWDLIEYADPGAA